MRSVFLSKNQKENTQTILHDDSDQELSINRYKNRQFTQSLLVEKLQQQPIIWQDVADIYKKAYQNLDQLIIVSTIQQIFQNQKEIDLISYSHCLLRFSTNDEAIEFENFYYNFFGYCQNNVLEEQVCIRLLKIMFNLSIDIDLLTDQASFKGYLDFFFEKYICLDIDNYKKLLLELQIILIKKKVFDLQKVQQLLLIEIDIVKILPYQLFLFNELIQFLDKDTFLQCFDKLFYIKLKQAFDLIQSKFISLKLFESLTLTLQTCIVYLKMSFFDEIKILFEISIKNQKTSELFYNFLLIQVKDQPIQCIMKNIPIEIVHNLMSLLNTDLVEICLDVFIELQDSFEPQQEWFRQLVYAHITNEVQADSIAIILEQFLYADELFWTYLGQQFDYLSDKLQKFDYSKIVQQFLEECQIGLCERDDY